MLILRGTSKNFNYANNLGFSPITLTADINLKIVVCGLEIVVASTKTTSIIVNELVPSGKPYQLSQSTISDYFSVDKALSSEFCG